MQKGQRMLHGFRTMICLGAMCAAQSAWAVVSILSQASVQDGGASDSHYLNYSDDNIVTDNKGVGVIGATAVIKAYGSHGTLKAHGVAVVNTYNEATVPNAYARAAVSFQDAVTINSASRHGQKGHVTGHFYVGNTSQQVFFTELTPGFVSSYVEGRGWVNGSQQIAVSSMYYNGSEQISLSKGFSQGFSVTAEFTYGTPFEIVFQLDVHAHVTVSRAPGQLVASGSAVTDSGHSGYWDGLDVTALDGTAITDFSLSSASGTDYMQSSRAGASARSLDDCDDAGGAAAAGSRDKKACPSRQSLISQSPVAGR